MRKMRPMNLAKCVMAGAFALAAFAPASALAQPKAKDNAPRGVITLAEITITGRIQKPIAAVDVARIRPKLTLSELRQPFLERISKAIYKDPF
jgi:hypothetical protein